MKQEVKGNKVTLKFAVVDCKSVPDMVSWMKRYVKEYKIPFELTVESMDPLDCTIIKVILIDVNVAGTRYMRERLSSLAAVYCLRFEMTVIHELY